MRSQGGLLNLENEECVVFYLLSGQGPASLHHPALIEFLLLKFLSTGEELFGPGPIYLLPQSSLIQ